VILALTAVSTRTLKIQDSTEKLPLHHACRYGASIEVLELLLAIHPEAAQVKISTDGCLPLHYAAAYCNSAQVFKSLINKYTDALDVYSADGYRPYHIAMMYASLEDDCLEVLKPTRNFGDQMLQGDFNSSRSAGRNNDTVASASQQAPGANFSYFSRDIVLSSTISNVSSMQSSSGSAKSESKKCVVCMENDACRVFVPCGHVCLCNECGNMEGMRKCGFRCPECRRDIDMSVRVYGRVVND
jgi:hypothetical protein